MRGLDDVEPVVVGRLLRGGLDVDGVTGTELLADLHTTTVDSGTYAFVTNL